MKARVAQLSTVATAMPVAGAAGGKAKKHGTGTDALNVAVAVKAF